MLQRIWTAIVAATAGAVLGLVAAIMMLQQRVATIDAGLNAVWSLAAVGLVLGFLVGGRRKTKKNCL